MDLHPKIDHCRVDQLVPYQGNARTHSPAQIDQIAKSIERFGFTNPILIGDDYGILAGHGRVLAAAKLGLESVPVIRLSHMSEAERRAYILADNKLAENAGWDRELLAIELQGLLDLEFDLDLTGFSTPEIDLVFEEYGMGSEEPCDEKLDHVPDVLAERAVTRRGDLWLLGAHRLLCGDARSGEAVRLLCFGDEGEGAAQADRGLHMPSLLFTDPPYNVPVNGHVSGLGKKTHREFVEGAGEMSREGFTGFLTETLSAAASCLCNGAIAFVCMDWRHMREVLDAGEAAFDELKNLCVWNKTNAGMGSFYRSKHELVFVFKKGRGAHLNNFGLGEEGRYRTNVWDYAGANSFGTSRDEDLAMHPTVKPIAMVKDAILDCSKRGDAILDVFGGSGSTLIAADQAGRHARLMELDPLYCDVIVRRFQKITGKTALHAETGKSFNTLEEERAGNEPEPRRIS